MALDTHPRLRIACWIAAAWLAALPCFAAEIVLVDDGNGHKVYVNLDDTPKLNPRRLAYRRATSPPPEIDKLVKQTAERHSVDPKLVQAIIQVESDFQSDAVSSAGAMGLMQLIPATAQRYGVNNPFNAKQNIEGGVSYLKDLLDLFDGDVTLSLAAYNAGEHAVQRKGGVPQYTETVNYIRKIRSIYAPGSEGEPLKGRTKREEHATIYKYVDASGVVHYTDGGDL
jgi:soluble lytic murein transglycosylase-like protein